MNELDCTIYVDGENSRERLVALVQECLDGTSQGTTVTAGQVEVDVRRNDDFDPDARLAFPDGFLHFPYRLEVYVNETGSHEVRNGVASLLQRLWAEALPAVAACDYETTLPEGGGYGSRALPWPGSAA